MRLIIAVLALGLVAALAGCGGEQQEGKSPANTTPSPPASSSGSPPPPATPDTHTLRLGVVTGHVPDDWTHEQPGGEFRVAQYTPPKAEGDTEPTTFIVISFGQRAGSVEDNLKRWKDMMEQPPGQDAKKAAKVNKTGRKGVRITTLDLSGTYKEKPFPMAEEFTRRPDYRMLTAVIELKETGVGPFYFRLVGPAKSVARAKPGWDALLASLKSD